MKKYNFDQEFNNKIINRNKIWRNSSNFFTSIAAIFGSLFFVCFSFATGLF
jgi:hypothetical protein